MHFPILGILCHFWQIMPNRQVCHVPEILFLTFDIPQYLVKSNLIGQVIILMKCKQKQIKCAYIVSYVQVGQALYQLYNKNNWLAC